MRREQIHLPRLAEHHQEVGIAANYPENWYASPSQFAIKTRKSG